MTIGEKKSKFKAIIVILQFLGVIFLTKKKKKKKNSHRKGFGSSMQLYYSASPLKFII